MKNSTSFESDIKKNTIKVRAVAEGKTNLNLTKLTLEGAIQCNKEIEVVDNSVVVNSTEESNCDIEFNNFRELKDTEGSAFFSPMNTENDFKYEWTVNYNSGETKKHREKFPISATAQIME